MTLAEIDKLESLLEAASPGPWEVGYQSLGVYDVRGKTVAAFVACYDSCSIQMTEEDSALIVAMRNALPEFIAFVRERAAHSEGAEP